MPRISTAALFGPLPKSKTKSKALPPEPDDEPEEMSSDEPDDSDDEYGSDEPESDEMTPDKGGDDSHEKTLGDELIKAYRSGKGLDVYEAIKAIVDSSSDGV